MVMDPRSNDLSFSFDDFNFESQIPILDPNKSQEIADWFKSSEPVVGFDSFALNDMPAISIDGPDGELLFPAELDGGSFCPSVSLGKSLNTRGESPSSLDDIDSSDPILKYISQMLMEENMQEKVWINPDDFAHQNTGQSSFYAHGEECDDLPDKLQNIDTGQLVGSPDSSVFGNSSKKSGVGVTVTGTNSSNVIDPGRLHDPDGLAESSVQGEHVLNDNEYVLQFNRGLEEATKFLPPSSQLVINFDNASSGSWTERGTIDVDVQESDGDREDRLSGSRGKRNLEKEDLVLVETKSTKQTASYVEEEEAELAHMLDKVLLCTEKVVPLCSTNGCLSSDSSKDSHTNGLLHRSSNGRGRRRRHGNGSSVDLRALLVTCAQALSSNDLRNANELLKLIRENSSPSGDGSQRLAHYFANGLEARMAGNRCGTQSYYTSVASKRSSVADVLKAYQLHFSSCPFMRLSIFYMNYMIRKLSQMAANLHIIDFGIGLGFKWPILIQKLGEQVGGPPKLHITGIELPQPGLRPAQRIEETGRRLARYCERFNVPFEYNAVPSWNWEAIKIEDLKIQSGETIVVTSLLRFENLLDETVENNSQKDAVLNLIRRIKPNLFVHAVTNGTYNSPFFVTRFKEALLYSSSIYDMLDATISSEHKDTDERRVLESEVYGRVVMNVVACEGPERVERSETYKQWQVRHERAGFKQLPLDRAMMKEFRHKLEAWYHKDFVLDKDGDWMLMGWKGRIMNAITCWVPV